MRLENLNICLLLIIMIFPLPGMFHIHLENLNLVLFENKCFSTPFKKSDKGITYVRDFSLII